MRKIKWTILIYGSRDTFLESYFLDNFNLFVWNFVEQFEV